jgi:alkanesulfonate monooxygenase SsuD/methylene tetrahydromethanopterin reductase-like flavin-dependent oxidoreductase (luciferase family)
MTSWGVLLPTFDPLRLGEAPRVGEAARLAEDVGFDAVWAGDHLACPAPVLEAQLCLAAAAAVTETVTLGLSVMLLGLRPLAWAAKQIATLQLLSADRLKLGVGVGGEFPEEFAAVGIPVRERGQRVNRALEALPGLLRGEPLADHDSADGHRIPRLEPAAPMPPILIGGRGDAALRRAARFGDVWLPMWLSPAKLEQRAEELRELAEQLDRPAPRLGMLIGVHVDEDPQRARAEAAAHIQGQYRLALERLERWTALGAPETVARFLDGYLAAGVSEFVLMPLGSRPLEQIEHLAAVRASVAAVETRK